MIPNVPFHLDRRPGDYPRRDVPKFGWRDDDGKPIHAIAEDGTPICGRVCSTTGVPCQRSGRFLAGNGRCVTAGHGGKAVGAPLKHGRYSKFLPTRLAATYEEVTNDDVLNNVRENIAVVVAMIQEKLAGMGEDSSAELWTLAGVAFDEVKAAILSQDSAAHLAALDRLGRILRNGAGVDHKEKQVLDLMARSSSLTRVEMARIEKMGQFMTAREMLANQATILAILKRHVEPTVLSKVAWELGIAAHAKYCPPRGA